MAEVYMDSKFLLKRGNAERWQKLNPILEKGEPGFVIDEGRLKVGDGITTFGNLPYSDENLIHVLENKDLMDYFESKIIANTVSNVAIDSLSSVGNGIIVPKDADANEMKRLISIIQNDKYDIEDVSNDIMNRIVSIASKATNRGVNRR